MDYFKLLTAVFAITYVLVYSSGPFDLFSIIRNNKYIRDFGVFECQPCTAFWISLMVGYSSGIITALSIWGVCIIIDQLLGKLEF